jgi:signal transduction histidine kinase/sugar lactone lactonase YvrE
MIVDNSGMIWLGTDFAVRGIDPKQDLSGGSLKCMELPVPRGLEYLVASAKGGYWRLAEGQVQKWNGTELQKDFGPYPWNKPVTSACEDLEGNLVVGTRGNGIWWFDADGRVTHLSGNPQELSTDYILSLTIDREGSLWVGTDGGGLDHVKRQPFSVLPKTESLTIQSVSEDAAGGLWINSHDGARYWRDGGMKDYRAAQGLYNPNGQSVLASADGKVWAGTVSEGLLGGPNLFQFQPDSDRFAPITSFTPSNNPQNQISVLFQDRKGALWLGTQGGLARWNGSDWKFFTRQDGLSSEVIQAVAEDAAGNLWVGTGNGLNLMHDEKFTAYHVSDGLPDEDISSLYVDPDGVLWIGASGRGLGRFHDGKWTRYSTAQGLLTDSVCYIIEDTRSNLWIGSLNGLLRISKQELNNVAAGISATVNCRAYDEANGLASTECSTGSQPGPCRDHTGRLWFPTIRGLASVDPAQISPNTNPPPVVIESVFIQDDPLNTNPLTRLQTGGEVVVPAGKENIEIRYASLNLGTAKKAKFKYRMETPGRQGSWTKVGSLRVAHYQKLPSGHYIFRVAACNEDDVWNETGATLAFFVQPPFWSTWWFLSLVTLVLLGAVTRLVHYFSTQKLQRQLEGLRQQQALEKERARIARDIHDQLGASMTQMSLLAEMVEGDKDDPAEVEAHAKQITQTARDTSKVLDEIVWTVNPSNDTLEGLINYICKYAQEYFAIANVRYRLDVPAQLPHTEISPELRHNVFLASKEAVTNVVRHAKATEVWLRLRLEPGTFTLELQDNGRGPSGMEAKTTRNGLRNMRKRMEDVGGSFEIGPAPEKGALVRLTAPINQH